MSINTISNIQMPPTSFFLLGFVILSLGNANGQYVFSNDPVFFDPEQDDQSLQATLETNGRGLTSTDDQVAERYLLLER